jgi:hypothetical protein
MRAISSLDTAAKSAKTFSGPQGPTGEARRRETRGIGLLFGR